MTKEGFWFSTEEPHLPTPKEEHRDWNRDVFIHALVSLEQFLLSQYLKAVESYNKGDKKRGE